MTHHVSATELTSHGPVRRTSSRSCAVDHCVPCVPAEQPAHHNTASKTSASATQGRTVRQGEVTRTRCTRTSCSICWRRCDGNITPSRTACVTRAVREDYGASNTLWTTYLDLLFGNNGLTHVACTELIRGECSDSPSQCGATRSGAIGAVSSHNPQARCALQAPT